MIGRGSQAVARGWLSGSRSGLERAAAAGEESRNDTAPMAASATILRCLRYVSGTMGVVETDEAGGCGTKCM